MSEPNACDWKTHVLAALTNEDPTTLTPEQIEDPDRWQLAFATLMAARGQGEPLYLAQLVQRVDGIERANETLYTTLKTISETRKEREQKEEELRRRIRQILRTDHGIVGRFGGGQ
ncbi:hypothetical protein [Streptomonospora litoralis]|uniref:Uncharacterized protein n=1 Tax=Streptomonospora litoralis TaxID=2498135 RepID=A0A4P6Q8N6_9ACTN|nr:hypothetical protein [Streptomonospora litoralis]QBI56850.1 hypothetical protein EKD16_25550 [Streptomonospora litoralis]